jgi:DNA-binding transcriptional ArsR family regulator
MNYDLHQHDAVARLFRALAEPARLSLVHCLADGPHRVGELSRHLGLAQSTVSAHLAVLKSAGLVEAIPEGRATLYRLASSGLDELLHAGERLVAPGVPDTTYQGHHDNSFPTPSEAVSPPSRHTVASVRVTEVTA